MNFTEAKRILDETECIFTWKLHGVRNDKGLIYKLEGYTKNDQLRPSYIQKWCVRVCLAYGLFERGSFIRAFEEIDQAVEDLAKTEDSLSQKCMVSCQHIVYAMKAWMKYQCVRELEGDVKMIPLKEHMTDLEKAGLLGFKANISRELVGKDVILFVVPFLREAIALDPTEYEWKISLVACITRNSRYVRDDGKKAGVSRCVPESSITERLEIIESLLNDGSLTSDQKTAVMYYKAETLADYRPSSTRLIETFQQIHGLWLEILKSAPENATYIEFGAKWFFLNHQNHQNLDLILTVILNGLERRSNNKPIRRAALLVKEHLNSCTPCVLRSSETAQRIVQFITQR